jgi:predicted metal-binding membrane protein
MTQSTSKNTAVAAVVAIALPAAMFLSMAVSPMFLLAFPLILSASALNSGSKKDAIAGVVALVIGAGMLMFWGSYNLGKALAERDNAMACPAKSELSPP